VLRGDSLRSADRSKSSNSLRRRNCVVESAFRGLLRCAGGGVLAPQTSAATRAYTRDFRLGLRQVPVYRPYSSAAKRYAVADEAYRLCSHLANASEAALATDSLPFRPLPVAFKATLTIMVRFPACGFLLVFYSNHSAKMHRFRARGMGQTERWTDRSQRCLMPSTIKRGRSKLKCKLKCSSVTIKLAKIGSVQVYEICERTDRQTDILITILHKLVTITALLQRCQLPFHTLGHKAYPFIHAWNIASPSRRRSIDCGSASRSTRIFAQDAARCGHAPSVHHRASISSRASHNSDVRLSLRPRSPAVSINTVWLTRRNDSSTAGKLINCPSV